MVYLISYDIDHDNKENDAKIIELLEQMGAVKCLLSAWLLVSDDTAKDIGNHVLTVLSDKDRLFVVQVTVNAQYNLMEQELTDRILQA